MNLAHRSYVDFGTDWILGLLSTRISGKLPIPILFLSYRNQSFPPDSFNNRRSINGEVESLSYSIYYLIRLHIPEIGFWFN